VLRDISDSADIRGQGICIFGSAPSGSDLKGLYPGDLPVQDPTKYLLAINRKTAEAVGISVPQSLLTQAGEVIE
jgi:hypothetical protein